VRVEPVDTTFYSILDAVQERHWWYAARRTIFRRVLEDLSEEGLPEGVLYDLGCGVGANLPVLERFGPTVGIDVSPSAVEFCHRRGRHNVVVDDLDALQGIQEASGKVVLLADVIEHLEDERPCLEAAHRALAPGGALVVTVPAYQFLWGPSDVLNHHKRRYTAGLLRRVIEPLFDIKHLTYFNTFLFGLVALGRLGEVLLKRPGDETAKIPPYPVNRTLESIFASEAGLMTRHRLPFGVSLMCIARKR
jgi:SAM-dependent methyltransferase